ncbi:tyrosine protein kinase, partial [Escherichia coli]|nr:tyrosine protein kinase [Escherichia coli]
GLQMKETLTKIVEMEAQGHAIRFMEDFVQNPANKYNLVPVLMNVQEGEKGGSITTYNELLVNGQRMLQNSKEDNPLFTVMDKQLDQMRKSVALTIKNAQESLNLTLKDLKSKEKAILDKMGNVPTQEREFMNYKRDQEIAQGVYLILLQKREEALLKLNKSMNRALIVDEAFVKSTPVAPRKLYAALAVFLLTIVVPVVYLFCKEQLIELKREYDRIRKQAGVI